jgi:hypothetical protein
MDYASWILMVTDRLEELLGKKLHAPEIMESPLLQGLYSDGCKPESAAVLLYAGNVK